MRRCCTDIGSEHGKRTPRGGRFLKALPRDIQESTHCRHLSSLHRRHRVHSVRLGAILLVRRCSGIHRAHLATGTVHHLVRQMRSTPSCSSLHKQLRAIHWVVSKVSSRNCHIPLQPHVRVHLLDLSSLISHGLLQGVVACKAVLSAVPAV